MNINLPATRKKIMLARESVEPEKVFTIPYSNAIKQFEEGLTKLGMDSLDDAALRRRGNGYIHANHSGKPWGFVACRGFESNHQ